MSHHRYQAAGFLRDDIVISTVHRTIRAAADAFFEAHPNVASCMVKRVRVSSFGDVKADLTFKPKRLNKITA